MWRAASRALPFVFLTLEGNLTRLFQTWGTPVAITKPTVKSRREGSDIVYLSHTDPKLSTDKNMFPALELQWYNRCLLSRGAQTSPGGLVSRTGWWFPCSNSPGSTHHSTAMFSECIWKGNYQTELDTDLPGQALGTNVLQVSWTEPVNPVLVAVVNSFLQIFLLD